MDPSQGLRMTNGEEVPLRRDLGYLARELEACPEWTSSEVEMEIEGLRLGSGQAPDHLQTDWVTLRLCDGVNRNSLNWNILNTYY